MSLRISFPKPFRHNHPPVLNVNRLLEEVRTPGQRAADRVASIMGSWRFIVIQSLLMAVWVALNVAGWIRGWDPYPFVLLNLVLSLQAAYAAPIIMMSQNRQAERDRIEAHNDYSINQKAEEEVRAILDHLVSQAEALQVILGVLRSKSHQEGESVRGPNEPVSGPAGDARCSSG